MKIVRAFHTHIEISPYVEGECAQLEAMLSTWISQTFTRNKLAYIIEDEVLYIPRGVSIPFLEKTFNTMAIICKDCDDLSYFKRKVSSKYEPKNKIQEDCIHFLCGEEEFLRSKKYSQLSLNADTGDGKTFCTLFSIAHLNTKAIIITHIDKIKKQWIDSCTSMFTFNANQIMNVSNSMDMEKIMSSNKVPTEDIFFVNHQTLNSFVRKYGHQRLHDFFKKIKVGIKVYDEAHLEFKNIIMIDMFTDTQKTIYLTANFDRSDPNESKVFQRAFHNVTKFGEQTINYDEKRRHIVYFPVLYTSNCSNVMQANMKNNYGFDSKRFFKYATDLDENNTLMKKLKEVLLKVQDVEGRIMILSPKIETCEMIKTFVENLGLDKTVATIHSKNTPEENEDAKKNADVISSTMKSAGTGVDIKGLRILVNLEPYASNVIANQMSGRLREYAPDKDTYYFDLVDISITRCYDMYKSRLRFLKKKCKKIVIWN